jgi:hypothetical protein
MVGTVVGWDGRYFRVECPTAPAHLRTLDLVPMQMKGAEVGATVTLEYQSPTMRSGLWNVVEVHDEPLMEPCEVCEKLAHLERVGSEVDGHATWIRICDDCATENPRERGDDDGVEYADPRGEW